MKVIAKIVKQSIVQILCNLKEVSRIEGLHKVFGADHFLLNIIYLTVIRTKSRLLSQLLIINNNKYYFNKLIKNSL